MNNSKIWLVVNPTVGLPLFLSAVAVSSFAVHLALVNNTEWIEAYHQGVEMAVAPVIGSDVKKASAPVPLQSGDRIKVVLPDGTETWAIIEADTTLASALKRRTD